MPFLIPAVMALTSDAVILWLHRYVVDKLSFHDDEGVDHREEWVFRLGYLVPLAILRLILLLLPLLYHSYNGTALRFLGAYQVLYGGTLMVVTLHGLALLLLHPASLETLVPADTHEMEHLEHFHALRVIWWMLLLTVVSTVCHIVVLGHVKSSAPSYAVTASGDKAQQPSLYFALRFGGARGVDDEQEEEPALVHAVNEFLGEMQARLHRAKTEWTARLDDFQHRPADANSLPVTAADGHTPQQPLPFFAPLTPFQVLLQLFAYKDVLENGKLEAVYECDEGAALTFFVPQLLGFLLHGADLSTSPALEEWILTKCRRNVHFAHRCYWYLRAWCLQVPAYAPTPTAILSRSNSSENVALAPFLDQPAATSPSSVASSVGLPCAPRSVGGSVGSISVPRLNDKYLPEERAMIERLMLRVKECGEDSARILQYGPELVTPPAAELEEPPVDGLWNRPLSELVGDLPPPAPLDLKSIDQEALPIHPTTGKASPRHLRSLKAPRKFGFMPVETSQSVLPRHNSRSESEQFDKAPQFLDALIFMAESLFAVPREQRKDELRRHLTQLDCELLPSNSVYVPIGRVQHRVWRTVPDESIALSTKERVPCIVCLEVIDFGRKPRRRGNNRYSQQAQKRSLLDRLPRRLRRSASSESSEESQIHQVVADTTDRDMLHAWRYGRRDPMRRVPLLDKVTTTVQKQVQGQMTQVRDTLNQFRDRDRAVSEELRGLTLAESLVQNGVASENGQELEDLSNDGDAGGVDDDDETEDLESGWTPPARQPYSTESSLRRGDDDFDFQPSVSRANSGASLVSMGQWSSPPPKGLVRRASSSTTTRRGTLDSYQQQMAAHNDSGTLLYGSDTEDPPPKPPRPEKNSDKKGGTKRSPPVVFRESWETKKERVRAKSVYGSHPGWRLLPVLIKANDDLRQEQLASQLIYRMAMILAREKVPVWLCAYEILALTDSGGIIEAIPDTISLDSLKRNDPNFSTLRDFYHSHFGEDTEDLADAKANFVESLAAYSVVCFLLQIKDRHNGNILIDSRGHVIHIDWGFFFLSSPGKNAGFESAPFKLTREFMEVMGGPNSHLFRVFRELCVRTFLALRRNCMEIILLVEMLKAGNEELKCFRGRPDDAIEQLRQRFRLDLNDRACREFVHSLVDDSMENWRTDWYDRYQKYFVGVW